MTNKTTETKILVWECAEPVRPVLKLQLNTELDKAAAKELAKLINEIADRLPEENPYDDPKVPIPDEVKRHYDK